LDSDNARLCMGNLLLYRGGLVLRGLALLIFLLFPFSLRAETKLLEVELAREVENRNPIKPYSPLAYCEKDKNRNAPLPRVNSVSDRQVVFWNRIQSTTSETLRHTWHRKSEKGWEPMARVNLQVEHSSSFRIWSIKDLHPTLHQGEWMVVASLTRDPKHVLCITRFIVE